nr:MAG TPA: hypothetical protein [Caudoviricetes sp.]
MRLGIFFSCIFSCFIGNCYGYTPCSKILKCKLKLKSTCDRWKLSLYP